MGLFKKSKKKVEMAAEKVIEAVEVAVEKVTDAVQEVLADMREQALPVSRDEFESRAVLYYVLLRLEDFLLLKRRFYEENAHGADEYVHHG